MKITKSRLGFYEAYYKQLKGARIVDTFVEDLEGNFIPHLYLELPSGERLDLEIYSGTDLVCPGYLYGVPIPLKYEIEEDD